MMTRTFASVAVMAALGLLAPIHANAFGLGKLELSSALNEPFKAEIAITALKGDELNNLQVRLASSKEFEQAGIDRNFLLTQLKFDVVEKSGNVKIMISSQQPIREPFIDFLLTASTSGSGRLIREYTVLLDPPKNIFNKTTTTTSVQTPVKNNTSSASGAAASYKTAPFSGDSYGPVRRTDTLWDVALKTKPESDVSVHQMMMALLKANPSAFQHGNVNGLKAGYKLTIPSKNDIYKLSKQQAVNAFSEQNLLWKNRNVRPAPQIETVDDKTESKAEATPAVDKVVAAETQEAVADINETARLKLVSPTEQSSLNDETLSPLGAEKIKVLSEQLTLAQETIEGQTQENIDFKSRMDALEVQMETMRRLISLKDADLARLQSMLESEQAADATTANSEVADSSNIESTDESLKSAPQLNEESNANPSDSLMGSNTAKGKLESLVLMAQKFVDNNKLQVGIGAASLLLLLVALLIVKRRKDTDEVWQDAQVTDNDDNEAVFSQQPMDSNEDKLDKTISVAAVEKTVETIVIDEQTAEELIDQAEMFVAYAEYEKAMSLLEQAKQLEPSNPVVSTKLLYVMFKQQLTEPFVTLASSLNIDKDSSEWLEIAAWGRELAPLNTLFNVAEIASEPVDTNDLDTVSAVQNDELLEDFVVDKVIDDSSSNTIEFNLDSYNTDTADLIDAVEPSVEPFDEINNQVDESLSIDTSFSLEDETKTTEFDTPLNFDVDANRDDAVLSLDDEPLSLDLSDEISSTVGSSIDNVDSLNADLNIESEDNSFEFDISAYDEIDEAETKLDLAAAYADMGDPDGARNILEEVLKEGNDEQKSKAQALLKSLS